MTRRKAYSYIRMSTDTQLKGDSLRRQLEASEAYAKNHDLELVKSIDGILLEDIGVSAFKGKNTEKGVLAVFLDALNKKQISKNSVLLIESLDRLSRDKLSEALAQFMSILNKGVEIVTLADNQVYTKEIINQNVGPLFVSLGIMFRANEESEMKSKRLTAAWDNKRRNASNKIISRKCPAWLQYSETSGKFEVIEERVKVVKMIFDMCVNTCGIWAITRHLNQTNTPTFGKAKLWHLSYVRKIIGSRALLGEFHPISTVDGKKEKVGEPINDYFPKVIDEQTFLLAQVSIARRHKLSKGRKGKTFTNLFSGMTYCSKCGERMLVRSHREKSTNIVKPKYLTCLNHSFGGGCDTLGWRLDEFEQVMFRHLREVNFEDLIVISNDEEKVSLSDQVEALEEKLKVKNTEIDRVIDFIMTSDLSSDAKIKFQDKINQSEAEKKLIQSEIKELVEQIEEESEANKIINSTDLKNLLLEIDNRRDDYMFRSAINQYLHKLIDRIELLEPNDEFLPWEYEENSDEVLAFKNKYKTHKKSSLAKIIATPNFKEFCRIYNRTVLIRYKSGIERHLIMGIDASISL